MMMLSTEEQELVHNLHAHHEDTNGCCKECGVPITHGLRIECLFCKETLSVSEPVNSSKMRTAKSCCATCRVQLLNK